MAPAAATLQFEAINQSSCALPPNATANGKCRGRGRKLRKCTSLPLGARLARCCGGVQWGLVASVTAASRGGGGGGAAPQARQCNDAGSHEVVVQRRSTQTRRIEGATHCTQHRSRQHEEPAEVCKWLHSSMGAPLHRKQRPTGRPNLEPGIGCLRRRRLGNCNIEHGHALDNERNRTQCAHDAHGWAYNMLYAYCIHLPCVGYVYE